LQSRYTSEAQRVDRAVLFAPCDLAINAVPPSFLKLLGLKGGMVAIGKCLGVFDAKVRDLTKRSFQDPPFATFERQQRYGHALSHFEHLEAAKAMLLQAVPFSLKTGRPEWEEIDFLVDNYANISAPVLIVYGTRDETLSAAMGNKLKDEIPGAVLVKVPRRGHALPTEDPLVCSQLIQRFQQGRTPAELAAGLGVNVYPATTMLRPKSLLITTAASVSQTTPPVPRP
jgi:pimeloyl-ACP methyl ester carboxylesterase